MWIHEEILIWPIQTTQSILFVLTVQLLLILAGVGWFYWSATSLTIIFWRIAANSIAVSILWTVILLLLLLLILCRCCVTLVVGQQQVLLCLMSLQNQMDTSKHWYTQAQQGHICSRKGGRASYFYAAILERCYRFVLYVNLAPLLDLISFRMIS